MPRTSVRRAHFVGLGGIGVSALAQWLACDSWHVSGTDRAASDITAALGACGIPVTVGDDEALPEDTDLLVYSDAIPEEHPLRVVARARDVRTASYQELLGELTRPHTTVAVAGSHGKSTATALVGLMLEAAGRDPTVVVGTRVPCWMQAVGSPKSPVGLGPLRGRQQAVGNFRKGLTDLAVVEADEYRKHFLTLTPAVAVVTAVDHDHVDAFPTPEDYEAAFVEFVRRVPPTGTVVLPAGDAVTRVLRAALPPSVRVLTFGVTDDARAADVAASPPIAEHGRQTTRLSIGGRDAGGVALQVPGVHVVANAAAAVAAVQPLGVPFESVRRALEDFRGTWRRFERVGTVNGAPLISDYAHHPTELRALAAAARQWYPQHRLLIAFQPHQHARTKAFASAFLQALTAFDEIILAEVYDVAGREGERERTTTRDWVAPLQEAGKQVTHAPTLDAVAAAIQKQATSNDLILVVGAGDIDTVARRLVRHSHAG